jgi:glycogen debranching enzyme
MGPFVDAWLRISPDAHASVAGALRAFDGHLSDAGVGSISEVFDAESPYTPRGCIAQAWSVAEVLRAWTMVNPTSGPRAGGSTEDRTLSQVARA